MSPKRYGVFTTPQQRAIAARMDKIHRAAEARSDNPFFWPYTAAETEELRRLNREYRHAAWCAQVDAEQDRNPDGGEVVPF